MRKAHDMRAAWSAFALCALIAVAGCSKEAKEPETAPTANESVEVAPAPEPIAPPASPPAEVAHEAPPPPEPKVPPPPAISADAQMLHDAEASGMTARLPRGNESTSTQSSGEADGITQ